MQEVRTQSLGLGMQRNGTFSEVVVPIAVGDSLCLYTDGVTEAANKNKEQFGVERLMKLVANDGRLSADTFSQNVLKEVKAFASANELKDDATIVCIRISIVRNG
jgi:sigma-B regulation protein RsbU (phosphoserine phosphatase)